MEILLHFSVILEMHIYVEWFSAETNNFHLVYGMLYIDELLERWNNSCTVTILFTVLVDGRHSLGQSHRFLHRFSYGYHSRKFG